MLTTSAPQGKGVTSALEAFDKGTLITVLNLFSDEQLESLDQIDKEYVYSLISKGKELFARPDTIEVEEEEELRIGPTTNQPEVLRTIVGQQIGNSNMIELYNGLSKEDRIRAKNDAINTVNSGLDDFSSRIRKRIYSDGPIRFWTNLIWTFGKRKYSRKNIAKYIYRPRKYNMQAHIQFHSDLIGVRNALLKGHYGTGGLKLMRTWYIKSATNNYLGYFKSLSNAFARVSFVYELIGSYCGFSTMNNITSYATFAKATLSTQTKHLWNEKEKLERKLKGVGSSDVVCTKANFNSCNVNRCLDYLKKELERLEKKVGKTKQKTGKFPGGGVPDIPDADFSKWKDYLEWAGVALSIILALSMGGTAIALANSALQSPVYVYRDYFVEILRFLMPEDEVLQNDEEKQVYYLGYLPRIKRLVDAYTTSGGEVKASRKYNLRVYDQKIARLQELVDLRGKKLSNRLKGLAFYLGKHTRQLHKDVEVVRAATSYSSIEKLVMRMGEFGTSADSNVSVGNTTKVLYLKGSDVYIKGTRIEDWIDSAAFDATKAANFGTATSSNVSVGSTAKILYLQGSNIYINGVLVGDYINARAKSYNLFGTTASSNVWVGNSAQMLYLAGSTVYVGGNGGNVCIKGIKFESWINSAKFDATAAVAFGTATTSGVTLGTAGQTLTLNGSSITSAPLTAFVNSQQRSYNQIATAATGAVTLGVATQDLTIQAKSIVDGTGSPLTTFVNDLITAAAFDATKAANFGTAASSNVVVGSAAKMLYLQGNICLNGVLVGDYINARAKSYNLFGTSATSNVTVGNPTHTTSVLGTTVGIGSGSSDVSIKGSSVSVGTGGSEVYIKGSKIEDWVDSTKFDPTAAVAFGTAATGAVTVGTASQDLTIQAKTIVDGTGSPLTTFVNDLVTAAKFDATTAVNFGTAASSNVSVGNTTKILYLKGSDVYINRSKFEDYINARAKSYNMFGTSADNDIHIGNPRKVLYLLGSSIYLNNSSIDTIINTGAKSCNLFGTTATTSVSLGNTTQDTTVLGNTVNIGGSGSESSALQTRVAIGGSSGEVYIKGTRIEDWIDSAKFDATKAVAFGTSADSNVTVGNTKKILYLWGSDVYVNGGSIDAIITKAKSYNLFGTVASSNVILGNPAQDTIVLGSSVWVGDTTGILHLRGSDVYIKEKKIEDWVAEARSSAEAGGTMLLRMDEHILGAGQDVVYRRLDFEYAAVYIKAIAVGCTSDARIEVYANTEDLPEVISHAACDQIVVYPINKKIDNTALFIRQIAGSGNCLLRVFLYI